jgi:hypothetical protein
MEFLINYDLRGEPRIYEKLWAELKRLRAQRVLYSTWYLSGNYTAAQLRDHFMKFIDENDGLFVVRFDDWASCGAEATPGQAQAS